MNTRKRYGKLIANRREECGMQGKDLAALLGIAPSTLSNIETGQTKYPPEPEFLDRIWRTLGLSKRSLLEALGYLDPEAVEPGVAYVIPEGDPRARVLSRLDGQTDEGIAWVADLLGILLSHRRPAATVTESEGKPIDQPA